MGRRDERDELRKLAQEAKAEASAGLAEAREAHEAAARRRPWVESLADTVQERRGRNGFGHDFAISVTPRWRRA